MDYRTSDDIYQALESEKDSPTFMKFDLAKIDADVNKCNTIEELLTVAKRKATNGELLYYIITGDIYHGEAYLWYTGPNHDVENSKFLYDRDLAIQYYQKAVDLGSCFACSRLGDTFSGYALEKCYFVEGIENYNLSEAIDAFLKERSAETNDQLREQLFSIKKKKGDTTLDYETAANFYQLGADRGSLYCYEMLALSYYYGDGVEKDAEKSRNILDVVWDKIKGLNNIKGMNLACLRWSFCKERDPIFLYGMMNLKGLGGYRDLHKAGEIFEKGIKDEILGCTFGLAQVFIEQRQYKEAIQLLRKICSDSASYDDKITANMALESLAELYRKGYGGVFNKHKADKLENKICYTYEYESQAFAKAYRSNQEFVRAGKPIYMKSDIEDADLRYSLSWRDCKKSLTQLMSEAEELLSEYSSEIKES